jgi:adenosylcobinamide-GDP ribazoletransferase
LLTFGAGSFLTKSPLITVILVLLVQYFGFNLFHLDGLIDTADAFLGAFEKEKRLAILKDSRIGVYGFFAGFALLNLKAALLYVLYPLILRFPAGLLAWPLCGRFSAALIPCMAPPIGQDGLRQLSKDARVRRCLAGILWALCLWTLAIRGLFAIAAHVDPVRFTTTLSSGLLPPIILLCLPLAAGPPAALFFARLYHRCLGGYTGDALGAAVETAEVLYLIAALVILRFII